MGKPSKWCNLTKWDSLTILDTLTNWDTFIKWYTSPIKWDNRTIWNTFTSWGCPTNWDNRTILIWNTFTSWSRHSSYCFPSLYFRCFRSFTCSSTRLPKSFCLTVWVPLLPSLYSPAFLFSLPLQHPPLNSPSLSFAKLHALFKVGRVN